MMVLVSKVPEPSEKKPTVLEDEIRVKIASEGDIVSVRQKGRALAGQLGFSLTDVTLIATAISELARNIVLYAKQGEIIIGRANMGNRLGIMVVACDQGPGIPNLEQALMVGYSTSGNLGLGLPGIRRLMDEFEITSEVGRGTTVTVKKWKM